MKMPLVANQSSDQACIDCAVRRFAICAALDHTELKELGHLGRHVCFTSRETVFAQGEPAMSLYNLLEGVMRLYQLLPDGRRQIVGFALPGDFLGMSNSACHSFSADAIGPVVVCQIPRISFTRFVDNRPHLLRRINEFAVRELGQAQDQMMSLGRRSAEEKVASFLIGWRHRLIPLTGPTKKISLPMGRQDIADFLGLTIETVSRIFTKLERDGVIEIIPGGVCLLDLARVEALAAA